MNDRKQIIAKRLLGLNLLRVLATGIIFHRFIFTADCLEITGNERFR